MLHELDLQGSFVILGIPSDVKTFISRHINSVWQLETLLCLKRAGVSGMNIEAIAKELYIAESAVSDQIGKFVNEGFATKDPGGNYKYRPVSAEDAQIIEVLEALYAKRRVAVTDTIYRQTGQSMQPFSQDFKEKVEGTESTE